MPTQSRRSDSLKPRAATTHLPRQAYIVWLVLIYAALLCTAWVILAYSSKRPFGRSSYNCYNSENYCRWPTDVQALQNKRTLRFIADAQTILSAVSLLTIPLTSAVCAAAVVPWLQHSGLAMSVRQLMTLADKGWTSPYIYARLISPSGWKRYGSSFIALAMLLHALGAALSPAITRLTSLQNIKVPTNTHQIDNVASVNDLVTYQGDQILPLRDRLKDTLPSDYQQRLWQQTMLNCSEQAYGFSTDHFYHPTECDGEHFPPNWNRTCQSPKHVHSCSPRRVHTT